MYLCFILGPFSIILVKSCGFCYYPWYSVRSSRWLRLCRNSRITGEYITCIVVTVFDWILTTVLFYVGGCWWMSKFMFVYNWYTNVGCRLTVCCKGFVDVGWLYKKGKSFWIRLNWLSEWQIYGLEQSSD